MAVRVRLLGIEWECVAVAVAVAVARWVWEGLGLGVSEGDREARAVERTVPESEAVWERLRVPCSERLAVRCAVPVGVLRVGVPVRVGSRVGDSVGVALTEGTLGVWV